MNEEIIRSALSYATSVVVVDSRGGIVSSYGKLDQSGPTGKALALIVDAVQTLGRRREAGELETIMMNYGDEIISIGALREGFVALFADSGVQPGLLFSHVRRLQSAQGDTPLAVAS